MPRSSASTGLNRRRASEHNPRLSFGQKKNEKWEQFAPSALPLALDDEWQMRLRRLARAQDKSMTSVLLACWQLALWRLSTNQQDGLVIGVVCNGRLYEELATTPGPLTRVVPVELSSIKDKPFEWL